MSIYKMTIEEAREAGRKDLELLLEQTREEAEEIAERKVMFRNALNLLKNGVGVDIILKSIFDNNTSLWTEFIDWKIKQ